MRDYFVYLPPPETPSLWGASVTAAGFTHIRAHADYPARDTGHPTDHWFAWEQGRVLDTWQLILIQEGSGWFETKETGRVKVSRGDVLLLFPGVWHRYAPLRKTGWVESWIEFEGTVLQRLTKEKLLSPLKPHFRLGAQPALTELLDQAHLLARTRPAGSMAQLSAISLQTLALLLSLAETRGRAPRRVEEIIRRAEVRLAERLDEPLALPALARELGLGYSYFRRAFREHTGTSPKQYAASLRFRHVQSLLRNSSLTIKEIADRLGYHSPFHLSAEFKKRTGQAPQPWRHRVLPLRKPAPKKAARR